MKVSASKPGAITIRRPRGRISSRGRGDAAQASVGSPKDALVAASADADLLVVGKTGTGVARTLHIGSVAAGVVRHSHCPIVLVPRRGAARVGPHVIVVGVDKRYAQLVERMQWSIE